MGIFSNTGRSGVDPNLLAWIEQAAADSPYNVRLSSGLRPGDPRFHGKGQAADVRLVDPKSGREIPNYQDPQNFKIYQDFANAVRSRQMAANPDYANRLRWGGYFSGGRGKYGALDLMHFDTGGDRVGMGGGGWDTGLNQSQAALWGLSPGGGGPSGGSPGGGGGGGGGGGSIATTMANAVDPRMAVLMQLESDPLKSFTSNVAQQRGGLAVGGRSAGNPSAAPDVDPGIPNIESANATITPNAMVDPASEMAPSNLMPRLANLFKVGQIGGAAAQAQAKSAVGSIFG